MSNNILKISEAASIALHAMIELAQNDDKNTGKLISVKEISAKFGVSANHLSKVMQRLNKAGLIASIKGFNGGFKLTVKPEEVTFLEIYELFDGKLRATNCILQKHDCGDSCIFGDLISSINNQVKERFQRIKLSDFIKQ